MSNSLQDIYAQKAISQIPRLLGNLDRNSYSPTYGCFHRDYWLDKTSDFPDAVRQFGVHALALVYKYSFPDNIYQNQPKIRDCTIAALRFWAKIQHKDGSFDEFYPNERGWVGPTAFTTYTSIEALQLLEDEMPEEDRQLIRKAISKAAHFIGKGEAEEDHLANHHAMACLALRKAYELLKEPEIEQQYQSAFETFKTYHNYEEGWSKEYDGTDPGYLSATVSFLGKVYQSHPDPEILEVLKQSVAFSSYFAYPNGFYAGSMGSRNTLHFYPHGYEIISDEIPLARSVADKMLEGLKDNKLVPPGIISDRYVFYRVPEFLLAYLDYKENTSDLPLLPYNKKYLDAYFKHAGIYACTKDKYYSLINLTKGGVVKIFNTQTGKLIVNDCGIIGRLKNGAIVTSQWIDPEYEINCENNTCEVYGNINLVPSNKLFTPLKNIVFRFTLLVLGWIPSFAHFLKGQIRKMLILGQRKIPCRFYRSIKFQQEKILITTEINLQKEKIKFESLDIGDEFFVRYVPQSRYFQSQELEVEGVSLKPDQIQTLNQNKKIIVTTSLQLSNEKAETTFEQ